MIDNEEKIPKPKDQLPTISKIIGCPRPYHFHGVFNSSIHYQEVNCLFLVLLLVVKLKFISIPLHFRNHSYLSFS